ncbi:ImuA family protein [Microvirga tunisiensis]|uniref:Damage-inducible mutagenesis protein n=1 Tax=Microvirga tunisiensis TaxID=2108360 RepID=A0A5N7MB02_9HYPH|nr:damage-inducible mutagenesis protein [Microvirga tunisiensis]MPR05610.1 damage-inducible mutagenesis protein [Microvirga tunisiensis]MPR23810.1 damage-inducible mutagenesis protein [Microvirga tunisiensis]
MQPRTQSAIDDLRRQIERLEGGSRRRKPLPFGVSSFDGHLPGGGLPLGALHEVIEAGPASEFAGTATLFVAGIAARLKGPILWCLTRRDLFAPGLHQVGLHPDRVIYAETSHDRDILPLVEEGLREKGLGAVVGEVTRLGLTASRRLQLAAEGSGVPALVLRRWWTVAEKDLTNLPTAATTRWRIAPASSETMPAPGLGRERWQVDLVRCRGAEPHSWIVEACDEKGRLALPADLADRSDQATARRSAAR